MRKYMLAIAGILLIAMNANAAFPVNDAGIAAYVRVGDSVDLNRTLGAYEEIVNINKLDIIGKVRVSNKINDSISLVYVGADGWVVAYYPKSEPASRIMQWNGYQEPYLNTTTLADAISKMATVLGVNFESIKKNITYYDFRYPEANMMMILVETMSSVRSTDSYSILIPNTINIINASYSHYSLGQNGDLKVDGILVSSFPCSNGKVFFENYNTTLFTYNIIHLISIRSGTGDCYTPWDTGVSTVLLYRHE